eukprot:14831896-Alexandrium_andersonii.AAC.1
MARSSGEAKPGGTVKGSAAGLGVAAVAQDRGFAVKPWVLADGRAAIGICRRTSIGKIWHLANGRLW